VDRLTVGWPVGWPAGWPVVWSSFSVEVRQGAFFRRGRALPGYVPGRLFVVVVAGNGHLGATPREEMGKKLIGKVSPFFCVAKRGHVLARQKYAT